MAIAVERFVHETPVVVAGPTSLIGLTGKKGAGKDEVAKILGEMGYDRIAFADPLKSMARTIGWDGSKEELPPCPHCGMLRGRQLLQVLGTEAVRDHIDQAAWLKVARRDLEHLDRAVVTDVRFQNEADMIRDLGGKIWRVVRSGYEGDGHSSEREQDLILHDRKIVNDGDLDDLRNEVANAEWN